MKVDKTKKPRKIQRTISEKQIDDTWMTLDEVASYLKATERKIKDMVYRRRIPFCKLGRSPRFHRPTIDEWMLSNSQ